MTKKGKTPEDTKIQTPVETPVGDYLMWVGSVYYPTVDDYIVEAHDRGPCKRIGRLPKGLVMGKSKIFLAHDDGLVGEGFVFGYFIPTEIQYLADDEGSIPESLKDRVTWVSCWNDEDERGCGERSEGMYMIGFIQEPEVELDSKFVEFKKPRRLDAFWDDQHHFRGLLGIDYGKKLLKATNGSTMVPPSRTAHEPVGDVPWTEGEDRLVLEHLSNSLNRARQAQLLSFELGRTKSSILYRFGKLVETEEGSDEE